MFKPLICYLFIFSVLFMGIESAVDSSGAEPPHGDEYAHVLDSNDPLSLDSGDNSGHCSHCCHGHTGNIAGNISVHDRDMTDQQFAFYQPHALSFSQAPPTPPPNA